MKKHYEIRHEKYGVKKFYKLRRLLTFARRVGVWDSVPLLFDGRFWWVGIWYKLKNEKVSVAFKPKKA